MTSKERVMTAFEHEEPDRVPAWCGASVEFWEKAKRELELDDEALRVRFGDDFRRVFARYAGPAVPLPDGVTSRTIFGIERRGLGYGQPTSHPLAEATIEDVHAYPWPDPECMDLSNIKAEAEAWGGEYAILGGDWSPFWHDSIDLFGMENLYYKMYDQPEVVEAAYRHMVDFYAKVSERIFDAAADVIDIMFIGNDLGSQIGPLLGMELFEKFVLPPIRRLIDMGHVHGLKVMLHCCGGFELLIPPLIEAGLDGLHAIQPCCRRMELQALKDNYGGRMLFNGAIDSQYVLIDGTPETVREDTRKVLDVMKPGGGYVAGASHDTILEETPLENVLAMFDAIREFGVYA